MTNSDKLDKILESLAFIKGTQKVMKEDIKTIKEDVRVNTDDLTEHKLNTKTNTNRLDLEIQSRSADLKKIEDRLKAVEFLPNLAKNLWKVFKWVGAASVTIIAIYKLYEWISLFFISQ